jgi:hypothetical protein
LQVLQDADAAAFLLRYLAQALDVVGMILMSPMGEVQAGHIHAKAHQLAQGGFGVA